ncbi:Sulfite exporter TauE/SafE [Serratia entomophila]|uniref:sulfite exporter TauE/SafE family protein n=1 Tax=Serratia entomophila TaxID=42906 RepID=UPI001F380E9A|nr:sulfite exporter TauE/SafE family protein [Serratia entomophila]UIW17910.1 sulfite exporter TauE/SafE family protein [Serratia entomophila]CAI0928876.1 Sulfite exporter TauE/SafE [Serratia entomophila]CAI0939844.1 Sulfite exporter TauE/SafE [Serratia entomophila]CAI0956176.1 Sulfite exporter TauE/SafE [Serratia entomophila]CAI0959189.1 Sulfite exporter TauE/SafE [Serratia entomophila]
MIEILIVLGAGFITGITTILFGFGGGFVVVPFVYHLISASGEQPGQAMHIAVATSTAVMILNASYATLTNWRSGNLLRETIVPLIFFIGVGAALGAFAASLLADSAIRLLFVVYMVVTIADCLFRRGFLVKPARAELSPATLFVGGPLIGAIATLLGVGGSVMTVPLLRRHGYEMKHCVSAANPLSIPVAVIGALMYVALGWNVMTGPQYLGYVNLSILGLLVVAGIAGILFAKTWLPKVNDVLHARIYVLLLILVLITISL